MKFLLFFRALQYFGVYFAIIISVAKHYLFYKQRGGKDSLLKYLVWVITKVFAMWPIIAIFC